MRKITAIAALGALSTVPMAAAAGSINLNTNLNLSATVAAGCTAISQSTPFTFPSPLVQATQPIVTGAITTTCAFQVPATIYFDTGLHSSGGFPDLAGGAGGSGATLLQYGLYQGTTKPTASTAGVITATTTIGFGTASGSGILVTGAAAGAPVITGLWAALTSPVPADIPAGTYSDTIGVTLNF
jgi:spore coat protein U-like protein